MAVGYEKLGEPTSIITGLARLGQTLSDRREKKEALDLRKQQMDMQRQQQQQRQMLSGISDLTKNLSFSKFATGAPALDKALAPQLDAIGAKARNMMNNGDIVGGEMYAGMAAQQLGVVHNLASGAIKNINDQVNAAVKQDPNIDANALKADLYRHVTQQFVKPDGNLVSNTELQNVNIPDSLVSDAIGSGNYYASAAPATAFFSDKKNMTPFEYAQHNGLGGGETIKGASSIYKPIVKDANGNYVPTTATEEIHIGDNHTAQVMPDNLYENLPVAVKGGITYAYNKQVKDPKSPLYTSPNSPLYGSTPNSAAQHPMTIDLAKRWVARNIADQVAPSYTNKQLQANRIFASQVTGGRSGRGGSAAGGNDEFYDTFNDIQENVPETGNSVTVNNFTPQSQKYLGSILSSSGSGLANNEAAVRFNTIAKRYELVDASNDELIAPLDPTQMNLSSNSKREKTQRQILAGATPNQSKENIRKGLKAIGIGRYSGGEQPHVDLSKFKKDDQGRIDLRSLYD